MEKEIDISFIKHKKIHAILIGIILFIILVKVIGMDFFLIEFVNNSDKYDIKIHQLDEIMRVLFINNIKNIVIVIFLLRLKHGEVYKYVLLTGVTIFFLIIFVNIFHSCKTLENMISAFVLYLPKYINIYIYILIYEKSRYLIEKYNHCVKVSEELIVVSKLIIIVVSSVVIVSFVQSIMSVFVI